MEKGGLGEEYAVLRGGERHQFAVYEEAFEPAFLAVGSKLKVGTLFVVDI
jgi:hypothetical protein